MFLHTIVVTRYNPGAHIDVCSDGRVTQISKVHRFTAGAEHGLFDLDEISDLRIIRNGCSHPEMGIRSDRDIVAEYTVSDNTSFKNGRAGTDTRIRNAAERMDCHVIAQNALTVDLDGWIDGCINTDLNIRVDKCRIGIDNRYAPGHQCFAFSAAHHSIDLRQFLPRIDT